MKNRESTIISSNKDFLLSPARLAQHITRMKYTIPPHIDFLDRKIMKAAERKIKRLMVNMPPRHGKSEYISKYFPFWYLGKFPEHRIILTSYQARFASMWGRKVKDLLNEFGEDIYNVKLNPKVKAASEFELLETGGGMSTAGAGGPLTGKGADLLIIDDPIKNSAEAQSSKIRENVWDWFRSTAYSRLEPEGLVIVVMTRWHEDDLCGRILKQPDDPEYFDEDDEKWDVITFPAIATEQDALGRSVGDALWEERYPVKRLFAIKKTVGEYWFAGLYQQMPSPQGGGIFKKQNFRYFSMDEYYYYLRNPENSLTDYQTEPISECRLYATVDLAVSTKQSADYTCVLIFAVTKKNDILVLDVIRERFEGADHLNLIKRIISEWHPLSVGIESVQYQVTLVQQAMRDGLPVVPLRADTDKVSRSLLIAARINEGMVFFLKPAKWLDAFESELLQFPNGRHDDQLDALAYTVRLFTASGDSLPVGAKARGRGVTEGF